MEDTGPQQWVDKEPFTDAMVQEECEEIIECLMVYGGLEESAARTLLAESEICAPERLATQMARLMLMHELPYYWAISLLYKEQDYWWNTIPGLWPPPDEYLGPDWEAMVLKARAKGTHPGSISD
jgi:hypothetical protein